MVEVGKIGDKTLVLDGRYISIFREGKLVWKKAYMAYILPDGNLYMYRRKIRITELSGNTLTDYQIKIEIGAGDPIFAHARSAGEDIRFCYYPEEEMLSYWIEKFDPVAEEAIIWVKVSEIPANSEIGIYMYYGNPEVASASDAFATFSLFDDFEDEDISDWTQVVESGDGSWNATDGTLNPTGYGEPVHIKLYKEFTEKNVAIRYKVKFDSPADDESAETILYLDDNNWYAYGMTGGGVYGHGYKLQFNRKIEGSVTGEDISSWDGDDAWHVLEWRRINGHFDFYYDDNLITSKDVGDIGSPTLFQFHAHAYKNSLNHHYDDLIIRKYTEPEPSVSVGGEE